MADRLAERQEARRRDVLDAAVRVFSQRGYRAASMQDIAARVGLSKPALYHYVQSKEQVLVELYEGVLEDSLASVRAIAAADGPAVDLLRAAIVDRVEYTCVNRRLLRVFFEEEAELPRRQLRNVLEARREYEDAVIELVERAVAEGSLALPVTPRIFVNTALGAANWAYKWYDPKGPLRPRELGEQVASVFLGAPS